MTKEKGRQVITAGGKDEKVMEKAEWGHSAFTKNLISGLKNELADANDDGIISGEELGIFIRDGVIIDTESQHTPQKGRIGSDVGEFVFISETLENEVAMVNTGGGEEMDEIKEQMATQQQQMAQLTELLLAQAQGQQTPKTQEIEPVDNYPSPVKKNKKSKRPKQPANMKTASTLSWVFPGMGHYYSGRAGKGLFYTGLELAALSGVAIFSGNFGDESDNYDVALANYNEYKDGSGAYNAEIAIKRQEVTDAFNKKQRARIGLISAGSISVGVWLWNIIDIKKSKSQNYSSHNPVSIGINSRGQVEARISF
jgi:hypothetical protein